jgi:tetratricopeptide (TPR) repeat protein
VQQEAQKMDPQHVVGQRFLLGHYLQLAEIQTALGRNDEAVRTAEELSELPPKSWEHALRAADIVAACCVAKNKSSTTDIKDDPQKSDRARRARELLQLAVQRSEGNADARTQLAWYLAQSGPAPVHDAREAVRLAEQATKWAPDKGPCWSALGTACYRAGDWKAACTALDKACQMQGGGKGFDLFFLAMARWQLGEKDRASQLYELGAAWTRKNQPSNRELQTVQLEANALLHGSAQSRR